jgi:hypothetical protein
MPLGGWAAGRLMPLRGCLTSQSLVCVMSPIAHTATGSDPAVL